jgi:hypothetical protein
MATKAFEIEVVMTVKKRYTVVADDEDEAVQKLCDSGIVNTTPETDVGEDYEEQYEVLGKVSVEEPDLD